MASSHRPELSPVIEGTELQIPTAIAIPLGFIVFELITNSIRYAKGRIVVGLHGTLMGGALSVSDDGPGRGRRC